MRNVYVFVFLEAEYLCEGTNDAESSLGLACKNGEPTRRPSPVEEMQACCKLLDRSDLICVTPSTQPYTIREPTLALKHARSSK